MSSLIKWRRGQKNTLASQIQKTGALPAFAPGRGRGESWPLPPLNAANAPLFMAEAAMPALVEVYEEYVDRYLVALDYDCPPRHWLHQRVPADSGVLDCVFPLLTGTADRYATEVLLIRLVWLIQQCPGLVPMTTSTEILVSTSVGTIGIEGGRALTRFVPGGVPLTAGVLIAPSLACGHLRVFNRALNALYQSLSGGDRDALVRLYLRTKPKELLRMLYDDGLVTGGYLSAQRRIDDKILSIEAALMRSKAPADTLQAILVPEYLSIKEYRQVFGIPWKKKDRDKITSDRMLRKMPLVRSYLESA